MKKKMVKRMATAALAGTMVMSMGMPAFAADQVKVDKLNLSKTVETDKKTYAPDTHFEFTAKDAAAVEGYEYEGESQVVYKGEPGGLSVVNKKSDDEFIFDFNPTDTPEAGDTSSTSFKYKKSGEITVNHTVFKKPGIYHYEVTENDFTYDGITKQTTGYDVFLYVVANESTADGAPEFIVTGAVAKEKGEGKDFLEGGKSAVLDFLNDYGANETIDSTHDVIIMKNVTGNQGNKSEEFKFTVKVDAWDADIDEWFKIEKKDKNGNAEPIQYIDEDGKPSTLDYLVNGVEYKGITLSDDETLYISGLSENDTYTINEESYVSDGYDTYTYVGEYKEDVLPTSGHIEGQGWTGQKLTADATKLTVINDKSVTTPTGIAMTFAPYALILALAGVFGGLFLGKKKKEDEI